MNQGKKISFVALFAIMISSFSLMVSYGVITSVIDNNEETTTVNNSNFTKPKLIINETRDISLTNETDKFTMQPAIVNNKVKFGVSFDDAYSTASFYLDLINEGNEKATISEIKISGLEGLENNVKVEIIGAKIGDIISAGESLNNISVSVEYFESRISEETYTTLVDLPNLEIEFIYE